MRKVPCTWADTSCVRCPSEVFTTMMAADHNKRPGGHGGVRHEAPRGGPVNNGLLKALPRDEFERLAPYLEPTRLTKGRILAEVGDPVRYVYFPRGGMVYLLSTTEHGASDFCFYGKLKPYCPPEKE